MFGHGLAQRGEPLPRVLGEEPKRDVVGRAAPRLHRQQLRGRAGRRGRRRASRSRVRTRVASRRLVGVAEGRVGDRERRLARAAAAANRSGPSARRRCRAPAGGGRRGRASGSLLRGSTTGSSRSPCGRLTVTSAEVAQQLGAAVGRGSRASSSCGRSSMKRRGRRSPARKSGSLEHGLRGTGCSWTRRGCGTPRGRAAPGAPPSAKSRPRHGELDEHRVEVRG